MINTLINDLHFIGFCVSSVLLADGSDRSLPFIDQCNGQLCSTIRISIVRNECNQTLNVHLFVKQLLVVETGEHDMTVQEFSVDERLSFTLFQECCHVLGGYYPNFTTRRHNYFLLQIWFKLRGSPMEIHCDMILS